MDNGVRFDNSKILQNSEGAYSLDQESVDLNSYLYAEKKLLAAIAEEIGDVAAATQLLEEAKILRIEIQSRFFDNETSWFYDRSLSDGKLIKKMGCEGWIPLWARVATLEQAELVMKNMMSTEKFNSKIPLQTLSADEVEFQPDGGYWRGPNWIDQAYFGIKGLRNYGYDLEALQLTDKILNNPEGLLVKGSPLRENYDPITGKGLSAKNFSWTAAHVLLLMTRK